MRTRIVIFASALAFLAVPSSALAKGGDRNHDRIPDRWEHRFGIALTKGAAAGDPDGDGLSNRGEFASHTNPRKADTNGNGVTDGNEDPDRDGVDNDNEARERTNPLRADSNRNHRADGAEDADRDGLDNADEDSSGSDPIVPDSDGDGTRDGAEDGGFVASFDGTTLTLKLFRGGSVSGLVDASTDIACDSEQAYDDLGVERVVAAQDGAEQQDDPAAGDPSSSGDPPGDPGTEDPGTDDPGTGDPGDTGSECTSADLRPGAVVHEADLDITAGGAVFATIDLVSSGD